ncbi:Gfo/Idh/MocA family oxidoreductase [Phragmitibacter flavus]|uniref:Gfo/Idh/MocA family oxidoreductase n=1 Tax=Phragmitibacter flavus TaxID=2576071 RepID=A0A5R8KEN0_9BACT|nr:Gfo/Idh/MocA family oxidoreductase [Phragmitibacter flavus]TLD70049.1 Gfo/Idh/MocA family oxidoreductase [Phragmitibacter flavus]
MNRRHFLTTTIASAATFPLHAASSTPMTVAVIGDTKRGAYGHGLDTLWLELPQQTQIVAVSDPDPAGLAKALTRLKVERGFASYQEMLTAIKPDLVAIGPRHIDQHHDMILAATAAGAKGIYLEKPFCRTLLESDAILAACKSSNTKLALAHRNRYHPVLPVIKDLLAKDELGRILEIRTRGKEDKRGGGLDLWVLGSHVLNLAVYFTGAPTACTATVYQDGRPITKADVMEGAEGIGPLAGSQIHARFETHSGIPIFFDSIMEAGSKESGFGVQIIGTKGIIDLRIDEEPLAHLQLGHPFDPTKQPRTWTPITTAGIGKPETIANIRQQVGGHHAPALDLIAAIKENRDPLCSGKEGHTTVEMISAVFESQRQNSARIPFPLTERRNPLSLF